tara:strand:+ start:218 stop:412 length:195 start_codon:yes stop_codon:yes gene_type:complete
MKFQEYEKILKSLDNIMDRNYRRIEELVDNIEWFKDALKFVESRNTDLYNKAIKYADEKKEGCI